MDLRAGPGGNGGFISWSWSELVKALDYCIAIVFDFLPSLLSFFVTPFGDLIDLFNPNISNVTTVWYDFFEAVLSLLSRLTGYDLLTLTLIDITFGVLVPFVLIFTIYRYLKQ